MLTCTGTFLASTKELSFTRSASAKGWAFPRRKPLYVIELEPETNRVVVGDELALERDDFTVDRCNWIPFDAPPASLEVTAKIRYNHPGTAATITPLPGGKASVRLHAPQRAITPGQAAVFLPGRSGCWWRMDYSLSGSRSADVPVRSNIRPPRRH